MMRTHDLLVLLSVHLVLAQRGEEEFGGNGTDDEGDKRIINGDDADENEYPFMVRLARKPDGDHMCGGSLLTAKIVMTAAHCLVHEEGVMDIEDLHIVVGDHSDADDTHEQEVEAMRFIIHEDYFNDPVGVPINDIALIVLSEEVTLTEKINVVTLPTADAQYDEGTTVTVIGWGVIEDEGNIDNLAIADVLQELEYTMTNDEDCFKYWAKGFEDEDNNGAVDYDTEEEMKKLSATTKCAIDEEGVAGSFKGDSGGPYFIKDGTDFIQLGIVSWGHWDPKVKTYDMMTNVFHYDSWITAKKAEAEKSSWLELHTGGSHGLVTIQDNSKDMIYTICNDGVGLNEVKAICVDQGYKHGTLGDVRDYLPDKKRQMMAAFEELPPFGFTDLQCDDSATHVIDDCTMTDYDDSDVPCFHGQELAVMCYDEEWEFKITHMVPYIKESRGGNYIQGRVECYVQAEKNGVPLDMKNEVNTWLVRLEDDGVNDLTPMKFKNKVGAYVGRIRAGDEVSDSCIACVAFLPGTDFYTVAEMEGDCPEITNEQYLEWVASHEEEDEREDGGGQE